MIRTALAVVLALCILPDAQALDLRPYNLNPQQESFVSTFIRTRMCMASAGNAARARGAKADEAKLFMKAVCGSSLYVFLRRDMSEKEAQNTLQRLVHLSYYEDVLGIPETIYEEPR